MKVMLFAPIIGYAMKYYVESFALALAEYTDIKVMLVVPSHFDENFISPKNVSIQIIKMPSPDSKLKRGIYYFNPLAQHCLLQSLKGYKPDLVHVINGDGYLVSGMIGAYFTSIPSIITLHDPMAHPGDYIGHINSFIRNNFVLKKYNAVHIHTRCFQEIVDSKLKADQKLYIVPHGSFAHYFTCYDTSNIQTEDSILFFGRLEYYKGIDILVKAGIMLKERRKNVKIIIAGPGNLDDETKKQIINNNDVFELHNKFLSNKEVAFLFKRSRVTVLPYRQVTQSSLPSIAIGFGHQIIASNEGAFQDEIPKVGGTLIESCSIDQLAEAMDKCLDNIRPIAIDNNLYEWRNIATEFHSIYHKLIVQKGN